MFKVPYIDIHTHEIIDNWGIQNVDQRNFNVQDGLFSIGLHPWFLSQFNFENDLRILENSIKTSIAIGECGLDKVCSIDWDLQKKSFVNQIILSEKYHKPLIIHCVKAFNEIMKFKDDFQPEMPWIMHGFNKKTILLEQLIEKEFYISLGEKVLQNENWVTNVYKIIPIEKLFFETDDNEIAIEDVYLTYARLNKIDVEVLKNQVFNNFKKVFLGE